MSFLNTFRYLMMSRQQFASRLDVQPDWEHNVAYYDVVQRELRRLHEQSWSGIRPGRQGPIQADQTRVLIDGVFFQLAQTGIARLWVAVLSSLVHRRDLDITILDRGNCPEIDGLKRVQFPKYSRRQGPSDSILIDRVAREFGVDVFVSTYYTTPLSIPSVLVVYDMIPEVLGFDLSEQWWREKEIAAGFARRFVCISHNTKADLKRFYPDIPNDVIAVAHCGLDADVFRVRQIKASEDFRAKYDLMRPYYIWVGSRGRSGSYKNADLFFDSVKTFLDADFDILCTGGERKFDASHLAGLPDGVTVRRLDLTDDELALAYSGALALVYPSLYEGFGMPVIEAMACGCPVITTSMGSLREVAGDAAIFVGGHDAIELAAALKHVREPEFRRQLVERGLRRAAEFDWNALVEELHEALRAAGAARDDADVRAFLGRWAALRSVQSAVGSRYLKRKIIGTRAKR